MDRRTFLNGVGASAITLGFAPHLLFGQSSRRKVFVSVFQRGAVDGLNMVIPFKESEYRRLRPTIAIPDPSSAGEERILDLDGFFGFHPVMAPLKPLFDDGRLGVVHAAGSPAPTRSHFEAQDYMESATPGVKRTTSGWMNRYVESTADAEAMPFRGIVYRQKPSAVARWESHDVYDRLGGGSAFERSSRNCTDSSMRVSRTTSCSGPRERCSAASTFWRANDLDGTLRRWIIPRGVSRPVSANWRN